MRGENMTATVFILGEKADKISLSKDRKTRNLQIRNICKAYQKKNEPCYVDITGGDIKQ